jgi:hypothetical protein
MKLRLTESDLRSIISSTVGKILKEGAENNEILSKIIERLSSSEVTSDMGENEVEVPLDETGNQIAFVTYEIEEGRYLTPGMPGADRDVPDDYPNVEGDFAVYVTNIVIYDENNNPTQIEDNGMVAKALKSLVTPEERNLNYYEDDFDL